MINQLITALNKEVGLSAEEIADTIWLALQMGQSDAVASELPLLNNSESQSNQEKFPHLPAKNVDLKEAATNQPTEEQKAGIYPRSEHQKSTNSELSFKVPDAPSLREPLTLARALKPLMRRFPSRTRLVLDEAATIQRIADEGIWLPVLKPTLEPWLELELVIDESISMQIWRHTIRELERLLKNYGIFRDVRVWGMIADEQEQVQIRRGIGASAKNQPLRSPAELIDPNGRRLVLVVSDCVSSFWRNGKVISVLEIWAKRGAMAIVQMLPKWLWKRTALGRASEVRLQGLNPGEFNQKLIAKEVSLWDELDEETGIKVPVFTLEPDKVGTWAQMLAGKGSISTLGYVFKLDVVPINKVSRLFNLDYAEMSAEERVQAFRVTASPMARKLAGLLAAAPVITLPIVRLIREALLKDSQQVHVAEVFLGGLLKPLSEIKTETNPDSVQYDFIEGVRELLVDSVPSRYVLNVVDEVSKYVAKKVGRSLEDFAAILKNPQQFRDESDGNFTAFATVTAQILRRLGDKYAKITQDLEKKSQSIRILCVDDEHDELDITIHLLNRYTKINKCSDFIIDFAVDGRAALDMIEKNNDYHLFLINWLMPLMDGIELARHIRRKKKFDKVPIIMISAMSHTQEAFDTGINDFISRPFHPNEFFAKIKYWLSDNFIIEEINFTYLNYLLRYKEWREADIETARLMFKIAEREKERWLRVEDIEQFPSRDLQTIDRLWVKYSYGRFGFSVQKEIYQGLGGTKEYNQEIWESFCKRLGWTVSYDKFTFNLSAPRGHLPVKYDLETPPNVFGGLESLFSRSDLVFEEVENKQLKELLTFECQTITVNSKGEKISTEVKQIQYFTEILPNNIPLEMVAIPGGKFMMGSPEGEGNEREKPQHEVTVQPFFIGKYPITQEQWEAIANLPKINQDLNPAPSHYKSDNCPVERVNWYDALEFCDRLSGYTGRQYRLPSEAEWEYACRAGTTTPFHFGYTITEGLANYYSIQTFADELPGRFLANTTPVGHFTPNAFGVYDMHGNVQEWCLDIWHSQYKDAPTNGKEWSDNNANQNKGRIIRGGAFTYSPQDCRSAFRSNDLPEISRHYIGFRVVCVDEINKNYKKENIAKLLNEVFPQSLFIFESVIKDNIFDLLVDKELPSIEIPDDNHQASITGVEEPYDIGLEIEFPENNEDSLFIVRFTLTVECELSYLIYKPDFYTLDDEKINGISTSEWDDHYFDARENYNLNVEGIISVNIDSDLLESSLLSDRELLEFLEDSDISINSITSINVA